MVYRFKSMVKLSTVLRVFILVLWCMEEKCFFFGCMGFLAAVPRVSTGKKHTATTLQVRYPVLIIQTAGHGVADCSDGVSGLSR